MVHWMRPARRWEKTEMLPGPGRIPRRGRETRSVVVRPNETQELSIRVDPENANHHLWLNNGTWFVHYTVYPDALTKARVRRSLRTKDVELARQRRDALFAGFARA